MSPSSTRTLALHQRKDPTRKRRDATATWLLRVGSVVVLGYVLLNRTFAWIHIPGVPVFAGEVVLAMSVVVILTHQQDLVRLVRQSPLMKILGLLFFWGLLRLAFDLPAFGLGALRDAAQTNYILVALAAAIVTIRDPSLLDRLTRLPRWIPMVVVIWSPIAIALGRLYEGIAPHIPGSETSITSFKPGDFALFAAAGISYVWLYQQNYSVRYRNLVTLFGALGLLVGATQNRGGLLGGLVMIALASVYLSPEMRRRFLASGSLAVAALIVVVAVANVALPLGSRAFSAEQLAENTVSLFGASEDEGLEGTVSWRLAYWDLVVGDVIAGGEWLTGKGFGTNLADTYGYQVAAQDSSQPLRNAHNSHITIVARLGLIGFFLWMAFWFQTALRLNRRERRQGHVLMKFLLPIMLAFGVSAVFDPLFEGPQMAIPFWFAAGIATGSMFLQRAAVVRRRFRSG